MLKQCKVFAQIPKKRKSRGKMLGVMLMQCSKHKSVCSKHHVIMLQAMLEQCLEMPIYLQEEEEYIYNTLLLYTK